MLPLAERVEKFLNAGKYITLTIESRVNVLTLLFDNDGYQEFRVTKNYYDLIEYFESRQIRLYIISSNEKTTLSLVEPATGHAIPWNKPRLVKTNIHKFFRPGIPSETIFEFIIMGKRKNTDIFVVAEVLAKRKPLEIDGYFLQEDTRPPT